MASAYGGPEVLHILEVDPGHPGPGQVLLEIRAAGVNPSDWKQYSGVWGTDPANLPMFLGNEAAGVVLAIGEGVDGFGVGDEVIAYRAPGAYSDRLVVPVEALVHKPAAMSWEKAGGLMVAGATAAHTLAATGVGTGDTVLIHGASGGVGAMAVQLAKARGARVIGTGAQVNHEYLTDLGATPVAYGTGLVDRVRALAPHGISAAIDAAGTVEALDTSVALVKDRHRIATIAGFAYGARLGVQRLGSGPGADPGTEVRLGARERLVRLWEAGKLDVRVGAVYHLADVGRAHRAGIDGRVQGKIILVP
ncbi:MAG: NADP-dependent oxidoreductase [Cellulomonadaceae bacterium]|nr:NADP-dependent oxidoreductase [Cellulomonadaceae bacterium]